MHGPAAAELEARDVGIPRDDTQGVGLDTREAQVVDPAGDVQPWPELVPCLHHRRRHVEIALRIGLVGRLPPAIPHQLAANEPAIARDLHVGAVRLLAMAAQPGGARQYRRERAREVGSGGDRAADASRTGCGVNTTRAASCGPPLSSESRGSPMVPCVTAPYIVHGIVLPAHLDPGVPAQGIGDGKAGSLAGVTDRVVREPAAPSHAREFVGRGRQRIGPVGREVLERERHPDQRVVGGVEPPRKGAKGRRDAAGVDVERMRQPGPDADVQRIRLRHVELQRADLGDHREALRESDFADERQAQLSARCCTRSRSS